jgi:nicotinate-nucleotide pyrophosphorylase (carboxylating)
MVAQYIERNVQAALAEDIGSGDITAELLPNTPCEATILCREAAILCGQAWVDETFRQCDSRIQITWHYKDGDRIAPNALVCTLSGPARPLLTGERTALNFLQTLSGTATTTRRWVDRLASTTCQLLDTRKTLPGLRLAQKYAVRVGGGTNHRLGLHDAYLIKENHIAAAGGIGPALTQARQFHPKAFLEIEVESLEEYQEALSFRPDRIMLDNFPLPLLQEALKIPHEGIAIEISGGVDESTLLPLAQLGVDCISVGFLTKHLQAIDFSFRITKN